MNSMPRKGSVPVRQPHSLQCPRFEMKEATNRGGLFVLSDRQHDGDDHPTIFAPENDAFLGLSTLHRYGTDWAGFRRSKGNGLLLHTARDGD